ncbi:hypothetical protein CEXT_542611 [Caerostris extrusa]|uniref:Uncharacterized protein n=1 Tax=Caerostris extrusa TaxID=172846 RepID=A0AAV4PP51_CAEEX|nr:hypothetical protein CEXT_542611 [Caerostris extrusa]
MDPFAFENLVDSSNSDPGLGKHPQRYPYLRPADIRPTVVPEKGKDRIRIPFLKQISALVFEVRGGQVVNNECYKEWKSSEITCKMGSSCLDF